MFSRRSIRLGIRSFLVAIFCIHGILQRVSDLSAATTTLNSICCSRGRTPHQGPRDYDKSAQEIPLPVLQKVCGSRVLIFFIAESFATGYAGMWRRRH